MLFEYKTDRLILRVLHPEKAGDVLEFYKRDMAYFEQYEPDRSPDFYTLRHQKSILTCEYNLAFKGSMYRYYVFLKEDPHTIIGTVSFHHIEHGFSQRCETGYKFATAYQGKGYATEALQFLTDSFFEEMGLRKIYAYVLPDNAPSISLLERVGFIHEGVSHQHINLHGQWRDFYQYARISPLD